MRQLDDANTFDCLVLTPCKLSSAGCRKGLGRMHMQAEESATYPSVSCGVLPLLQLPGRRHQPLLLLLAQDGVAAGTHTGRRAIHALDMATSGCLLPWRTPAAVLCLHDQHSMVLSATSQLRHVMNLGHVNAGATPTTCSLQSAATSSSTRILEASICTSVPLTCGFCGALPCRMGLWAPAPCGSAATSLAILLPGTAAAPQACC